MLMEKTHRKLFAGRNMVKGSNLLHLVWQPLLNHLVVLKQSVVMGNTCTGHESSVPEDASVKSALLDKYFLSWTD